MDFAIGEELKMQLYLICYELYNVLYCIFIYWK